jgi:EAL domain-containing protein (putative c-di-GMP-specific phosphodiesterase class I)
MYQAKDAGQAVARYDVTRDEASTDRLALLAEMREALSSGDQVHLLVQPAVRLADGGVVGVEALARWNHPRRGALDPGDFLPAVELGDLIGPFTRYVLDRALQVMVDWRRQGVDLPWAVNLSARGLLDPKLPNDVQALLERYGVPADRLVLEITESVVVPDLPVIDEVLRSLRRIGVRLAVDDFGTGFSSLTFLTRVQVDEVKIDRAFVKAMVHSPEAAAIVRTTVDLGRELGLRVVAEGVETMEQRDLLIAMGCVSAQGYLFFRPMPPAKALIALTAARPTNLRRLRTEEAG